MSVRSEPPRPSIDVRNVRPLRMPVGVAGLVGVKRSVRKPSVSTIQVLVEARLETRAAGGVRRGIVVLHVEQMRGQNKTVPHVLRNNSRDEGVLLRPVL
jgi:hypothetical protein